MTARRFDRIAATAIAAALSAPALAQQAGLDEILVTAQRREESAQDISVALTAISGADLQARGVNVINGLEYLSPSLEIESQFGSGQPSFSIRGIGFRDYATNNTPTVGVYVDEVAYPFPVMTQGVLFDVERVEVLRGPQGTLYGRNSTGGAINVVSRRPTDELSAGLAAEYGRFDRVQAEGFVSGPIAEGLRARIAAVTTQGGAWQENREDGRDLGDADRWAVRGLLEADVGERVELLFNAHYYQDNSDGLGLQLFQASVDSTGGLNPALGSFAPHGDQRSTSFGASQLFSDLTGVAPDARPFRDNEGFGVSLTATVDLDFAELTYISAYENLQRAEYNDFDAVPIGAAGVFFESDIDVITQEARLASTTDGPLSWIAGLYYSNEDLDDNYQSDFAETFGLAVFTPYRQEARTFGVFGQAEYQFAERLNFILGLRYEDENRDLIGLGTFSPQIAGGVFNFANGTVDGTLEDRFVGLSEVSGKVGVEFTPSEDVLFYATASRGVKSGGFTAYNTLNPAGVDPFQAEILWAYEGGFKTDLLDQVLRLNGAIYYYDYNNQQVQSALFSPTPAPGAVVGRIVNAGDTEIYGAELELLWRPSRQLTISQGFGYNQGEFRDFDDLDIAATLAAGQEVLVDRSGQDIGTPDFSYNGAVMFRDNVLGDYALSAQFDYVFRDEANLPLLGPEFQVDSFWLANARVGFGPDDESWEIAVFGRNIFNTDYDEVRNFFDPCCSVAAPGLVATYGVQVRLNY